MILFYFKEKPITPLCHGGKTMKKHIVSVKKTYENERKWGNHIQDIERLAEELQKYPCL